ncbi:hypothetical protein [Kitasatospora indigofera]|uniref:hypothetical protein n=1 Tax=Kitasatospora indigofera TaxID=67307 RepID=UPI0033B0002C
MRTRDIVAGETYIASIPQRLPQELRQPGETAEQWRANMQLHLVRRRRITVTGFGEQPDTVVVSRDIPASRVILPPTSPGRHVLQHEDVHLVVEDVPALHRGGRGRQPALDPAPAVLQRGGGERHEVPYRATHSDPLGLVPLPGVVEVEWADLVARACGGHREALEEHPRDDVLVPVLTGGYAHEDELLVRPAPEEWGPQPARLLWTPAYDWTGKGWGTEWNISWYRPTGSTEMSWTR